MKVAVAISGGVDSSVAALLLKKRGFDVIGVTMRLWSCFKTPRRQTCCSLKDEADARAVCEKLKIPFAVINLEEAFKKHVVSYFVDEYARGRTPNPCVKCNEILKFKLLREECSRLFGTSVIATGHHARISPSPLPFGERVEGEGCIKSPHPPFDKGGQGGIKLLKGSDPRKDQSYFLFSMTQNQLARTLFPVGNLTKAEVRKLAREAELPVSDKRDSQDICFAGDGYAEFIQDQYQMGKPGNFVDSAGNILGRHEGIHAYTIGQGRGLNGRKYYVVRIDPDQNEVVLGEDSDLYRKEMVVEGVSWIRPVDDGRWTTASPRRNVGASLGRGTISSVVSRPSLVKIRYAHAGAKASLTPLGDNRVRVEFIDPQRAITPGQAAVFYREDEVLGGGWIE